MNNTNTLYIFLDFDGVLHTNQGNRFSLMPNFLEAINNENIKIVFSTSWREYSTVEYLAHFFPEEYRNLCIGKTILIKNEKYSRYYEILDYVEKHDINNFIAIDDMPILFPPQCSFLFQINPFCGLSKEKSAELKQLIQNKTILNTPKLT